MPATVKSAFLGATTALALSLVLASSPALAGAETRLECEADSAIEDASMDARYEERNKKGTIRKKFDASFEAAPGGSFQAGNTLAVLVDGTNMGSMVLTLVAGDLVGDLSLDSEPDENAPFPPNPPTIGGGSNVQVGGLGCILN